MPESQNIKYKTSWRDEYLKIAVKREQCQTYLALPSVSILCKCVCGFADAKGGKIFIGIDDKGNVAGVKDYKKLIDDIPNEVVNHLGIVLDVNLHEKDGNPYLKIDVPASEMVFSFDINTIIAAAAPNRS